MNDNNFFTFSYGCVFTLSTDSVGADVLLSHEVAQILVTESVPVAHWGNLSSEWNRSWNPINGH